jgi:hypothetical protein
MPAENLGFPLRCGPSADHGFWSRLVADAFGAPVLRDQGPDRPAGNGKADSLFLWVSSLFIGTKMSLGLPLNC